MFKLHRLLIMVTLMAVMFANIAVAETWKIASLDWEPYTDHTKPDKGTAIQKLRELLAKENITLEVEFFPWARAKMMGMKAEYVGYYPAWPEEVDADFEVSPAIDKSSIALLKRKDTKFEFVSLDDLFKNHKVGIVKTYTYPKDISAAVRSYPDNVIAPIEDRLLMRMLNIKRFDIAITDPKVMLYLAEQEKINTLEMVKEWVEKDLVIAFRKCDQTTERLHTIRRLLNK